MARSVTQLTAYLHGFRVGWFRQTDGAISFEFDDEWREASGRLQLSESLPKSRKVHTGTAPENFLWGLLPDNSAVLVRWGEMFGANPRNALSLLRHVGLDTAGAVQLSEVDETVLDAAGGSDPLDDRVIAAHLRAMHGDPLAWLVPSLHDGNFSLAGAQAKFALLRDADGWRLPWGGEPTTHIVKPGVAGFSHQDVDEHLCLVAATQLGLNAAKSEIHDFGGESAIVIERYDRDFADGHINRIHQEDVLQAAGIHPALKYQNEGGPGITTTADLIRRAVNRSSRDDALRRFFDANIFNWIISGTDAHAKNYSLLHTARGTTLAPLYDVASSLPYDDLPARKVKLAMSMAGRYRVHEIEPRHILREATGISLDTDVVRERMIELCESVADAFSAAASASRLKRDDRDFAARLTDSVARRSAELLPKIHATTSRSLAAHLRPEARAITQPRRKNVGLSGNGGRFASKQPSN
ncbi:type II toxin-antitoxin system HipA family toxin [Subtercola endophyticus]|uniref:type II toxin-antitoxin system HipA family toxin n=1 Tax=Subtercola endophyticus TaxID=2895559 RepID=UPI001E65997E|nr:type II toxin-antitoxin system HipA family toxin [Subtercola endophyticus]UFS58562.1 type II toxin-antitoxin system HipA family toxin [Subtercola endophyticus]